MTKKLKPRSRGGTPKSTKSGQWLSKLPLAKGTLIAYARPRGGIGAGGKIGKSWARQEQSRLRAKSSRTPAQTATLRRLNLFLGALRPKR